MPQVTPYKGSNTLETIALGHQLNSRTRQLDQQDQRIAQRDVSLAQNQDRLDIAAKQAGLKREEFARLVMNEAIGNSNNAAQAAAQLEYYTKKAPDEKALQFLQSIPEEFYGGSIKTAGTTEFTQTTAGFSDEDRMAAQRIKAGLDPRAVSDQVVNVGDVPTLIDRNEGVTRDLVEPEAVADNAGTVAAGKAAGKQAVEQSGEAIKQLAAIKKQLGNIDDAIAAIDSGANSGAVASRLPSVTQSSIELDNARARLGLDVVGATTFGALSQGELDLALNVALPTNLEPAALRDWLVRKKDAQNKLAQELEGAAIYLGQPGNTPADYLQLLRDSGGFQEGLNAPLTAEEQAELEALEAKYANP
ncbi:MAG: hypothetical protein ACPGSC_09265 [Granulosicoccaceae bacterium]